MPTHPELTTENPENPGAATASAAEPAPDVLLPPDGPATDGDVAAFGGAADDDAMDCVFDAMQHQVAVFARRAEQTRLGGVGQARNSMDRAAYLLLHRLDREGPMGVKALAAGMGIDSSTVTRQVAPLVDSGLVKRTSHPEDGRAVVLQLSPRGATRLEQVRSSRRELMERLTDGWSESERATFCSLLTRFNVALSAAGMPPR